MNGHWNALIALADMTAFGLAILFAGEVKFIIIITIITCLGYLNYLQLFILIF